MEPVYKLNLVNLNSTNIRHKKTKFPDGQQSMTITDVSLVASAGLNNYIIEIESHLNSFADLELIICANKAIKEISNSVRVNLYVPYFLGARSDRKFSDGSINYIKEVIAPIINSQNFDRVIVLDPHSDVLEACINRFSKISNTDLVEFALGEIYGTGFKSEYGKFALVSPDGGSLKKIYDLVDSLKYRNQIVIASKHRDLTTGQIVSTEVHLTEEQKDLDMIIVDDICDGGRTFIELSKSLRTAGATGRIYLIVTHGIFSAGMRVLNPHFAGIFSTNSIVDMNDPQFSLANDNELHKLQQLNVF